MREKHRRQTMTTFNIETIRLGINNLRLHKLRSLLTALGIIFGVAAVICMLAPLLAAGRAVSWW